MNGCSRKNDNINIYCPSFPEPSKETIIDIKNINKINVDNWMKELFILKKSIENCKKKE